jgi:hypothetical protein
MWRGRRRGPREKKGKEEMSRGRGRGESGLEGGT